MGLVGKVVSINTQSVRSLVDVCSPAVTTPSSSRSCMSLFDNASPCDTSERISSHLHEYYPIFELSFSSRNSLLWTGTKSPRGRACIRARSLMHHTVSPEASPQQKFLRPKLVGRSMYWSRCDPEALWLDKSPGCA